MTVDLKDVTVLISPHKTAHFQLFVTGRYQGIKVTHIARSHLKWMRVGILGKDRADNRGTQRSRGFHPGFQVVHQREPEVCASWKGLIEKTTKWD